MEKQHVDKEKILNFIDVMSTIHNNYNASNDSRLKRRVADRVITRNKRLKIMNTSTPNQSWSFRNTETIPDETSPIIKDNPEEFGCALDKNRALVEQELDKDRSQVATGCALDKNLVQVEQELDKAPAGPSKNGCKWEKNHVRVVPI